MLPQSQHFLTYMVPTAVHAQVRRKCDATNKEEYSIQGIQGKGDDGYGQCLQDSGTDQIEEREHSEDGNEHCVVDDGGIAANCFSNHVPNKSHNEESPEELRCLLVILPSCLVGEWAGTWRARRPSWMKFMVNGAVELDVDRAVCLVESQA